MENSVSIEPLMHQIKASAGSGKTYDLTQRILTYLSQISPRSHVPSCNFAYMDETNISWGDILAITFTNSAAIEMRERVLQTLKHSALQDNYQGMTILSKEQASLWVDIILRQLSSLNIKTIDSFVHQIARMSALEIGLSPDFDSSFNLEDYIVPLLDEKIDNARYDDEQTRDILQDICDTLVYHSKKKGFALGQRIVKDILAITEDIFDECESNIYADNNFDQTVSSEINELASKDELIALKLNYLSIYKETAEALLKIVEKENLSVHKAALAAWNKACGDDEKGESVYYHKDSIAECLNKASKDNFSNISEMLYEKVCEAADNVYKNIKIINKAIELLPFVNISKLIYADLKTYQHANNKVSSSYIYKLAQQSLVEGAGVSYALCRLGTNLSHILIDEFQDTSKQQWATLYPLVHDALSRGGSLTWVGDVKQAIYGWRGGDVKLFDAILGDKTLTNVASKPIQATLQYNWRSRKNIVEFNNAIFSQIENATSSYMILDTLLPKGTPISCINDAVQDLQNIFRDCVQKVPDRAESQGGYVEVKYIEEKIVQTETDQSLRELNDEQLKLELNILLVKISQRRKWSDVAILVRSNMVASKLAAWLMEAKIPVVTENSLLLAKQPIIQEIIAFLEFINSPQNNLALMTFITGKIFLKASKLKSEQMYDLASIQKYKGTLFQLFKDKYPQEWKQYFEPFYNYTGLMCPYDFLCEFFNQFEVNSCAADLDIFINRFLEIVYFAECQGCLSLTSFLNFWHELKADEKLPMPLSLNAVRIMTIHKAKGLQFPIVIIPEITFKGKSPDNIIYYTANGKKMISKLCKQMGDIYYSTYAQGIMENINVLYVAFTRAKDELYIFHTQFKTSRSIKHIGTIFENLLQINKYPLPLQLGEVEKTVNIIAQAQVADLPDNMSTKPYVEQGLLFPQEKDISSKHEFDASKSLTNKPLADKSLANTLLPNAESSQVWKPMQWLPQLKIFRNNLDSLICTQEQIEKAELSNTQYGILVHSCMEYLQWSGNIVHDIERAISMAFMQTVFNPKAQENIIASINKNLSWFMSLDSAQDWLENGIAEQVIIDANGQLHRVDLLVRSHDQILIIDYKTGIPNEQNVSQLKKYMELLQAVENKAISGILIYLDEQSCHNIQL